MKIFFTLGAFSIPLKCKKSLVVTRKPIKILHIFLQINEFFLKKDHDKHANKQQVKQNQVTSEKCKQNILIAS
jgi:hypothetical protein